MSWFTSFGLPIVLVCAAVSFVTAMTSSEGNVTEVTYLVRELMQRYKETSETFLPPLGESGLPLEIGIHWYPTNILSFNERDQYIEMRGYITMEWHDPALQWNTETSEITDLSISIDNIWKPSLILQESQTHEFESVFYENKLAFVRRDGTVSWSSDIKTSTFCQVLQQSFPFDQQVCMLTFSSAVHYQKELVFNHLNASTPDRSISNGGWRVLTVSVPDCPNLVNLQNHTAIRFVMELKRIHQRYYVITLVAPCFILSAFTSLVFLYPRAKEQRFPLAIMNLLTLFVYQELVSSVGPPTGSSLLGTFVFITMLEAAITTVLSILSDRLSLNLPLLPCHLTKRGEKKEVNKPGGVTIKVHSSTASPSSQEEEKPEQKKEEFKTQVNEVTIAVFSGTASSTLGHGDKLEQEIECKAQVIEEPLTQGKRNNGSNTEECTSCSFDVQMFDRTAVLILFCLKFIVCLTFIIKFGSAADSVVDIVQCMDEYYFP